MKGNHVGLALIALGLMAFFGNIGLFGGEFVLLIVAAIFIAFYFRGRRSLGMLIPGCIIAGVGVFSMIEPLLGWLLEGPLFFFTMGVAFGSIHFIHKSQTGKTRSTKWAMYVGLGMLAFGAFVFFVEFMSWGPIEFISPILWPVVLIGSGLVLMRRHKEHQKQEF